MTENDLTEQVRDVEEQIGRLRGTGRGLTRDLGGRDSGPLDSIDAAAHTTDLEETRAVVGVLEAERPRLLDQLGGGPR